MTREELALKIGNHILNEYNAWQSAPRGKSITIPVMMPRESNKPDWAMNIVCSSPWFIESFYDENGNRQFKHWTMDEWMGWNKNDNK